MMHARIKRYIGCGFGPGEWEQLSRGHPVAVLYRAGKHDQGDRLLREFAAAHEAGHGIMARLIGVDVQRIVVAHLHEVDAMTGGGTLGFNEYRVRGPLDPMTELLLNMGGVAGHEVIYNTGWGLDAAAWTPAGAADGLRDEEVVAGGDLWEARECVRREILAGRRVLGRSTTADALEAGFAQAEGLLLGARGRLLALAGHLLAYGVADRSVIAGIWTRGE